MKTLFFCLLIILSSCGGSDKLQEVINKHNTKLDTNNDNRLKLDTTDDNKIDIEEIDIPEVTSKDSIVEVTVKDDNYSPKFPEGVKATIINVIRNKYKLSRAAENAIIESLANDLNIIKEIDISIDEFIKIKVGELERLGILVSVNTNSPVNISHKYKHIVIKGKDTICPKK